MNRLFPTRPSAEADSDCEHSLDLLESLIARFEQARFAGETVSITDYLPPVGDSSRVTAASELVRVDLEIARTLGEARTLEDYRPLVPELFRDPTLLALAAFEDWRLAIEAGEASSPHAYLDRYGLQPEDWPQTVCPSRPNKSAAKYPPVGETFDGMLLERVLGVGAFSRVYIARQPQFSNRQVALKITTEASPEPERLGRLQHTNIVPIYSVHRDRDWLGICMPLLGEVTLARRLSKHPASSEAAKPANASALVSTLAVAHDATVKQPAVAPPSVTPANQEPSTTGILPWREAAQIAAELAAGLAHAHERGLVHSDIKPANILIGDDGVPRLLDFNLANDASAASRQSLLVGGTLPYLAPEHLAALRDGSAPTAACDHYSLAVVLYEMLTGQLPYPRRRGDFDSMSQQLQTDRQVPATLVSILAPDVPRGLSAIVSKALAPNPHDRYASVAEFERELRSELADEPLSFTSETSPRARVSKWLRRSRTTLLRRSAVACGLLAVVATGFWLRQRDESATLYAEQAFSQFVEHQQAARTNLCVPAGDRDLQLAGFAAASSALQALSLDSPGAPQLLRRLQPGQQQAIASVVAEIRGIVQQQAEHGRAALLQLLDNADTVLTSAQIEPAPEFASPLVQAIALLKAGDFQAAAELLEDSTDQRTGDPALWIERGIALAALNRRAEARECFASAIALQPQSSAAWRHRAYLALDEQRHADALVDLERALTLTPQSAEVQLNRALAFLGLKQVAAAESAATAAIDAGAKRPRAYALRRLCRFGAGDSAGAEQDRQAALAAEAVDDEDWAARAIAHEVASAEQALAEVERGLKEFPQSVVLLRNQIHLLGDVLGRRTEALAAIDALLKVLPNDISARLGHAVCQASLGQTEAAYAAAQELQPIVSKPLDRLQLACVFALSSENQADRSEQSLQLVRQALAADPALASRAIRDPDLATLHDSADFTEVIEAAERLAPPPGNIK